jgi:hypothetical protein
MDNRLRAENTTRDDSEPSDLATRARAAAVEILAMARSTDAEEPELDDEAKVLKECLVRAAGDIAWGLGQINGEPWERAWERVSEAADGELAARAQMSDRSRELA